MDFLKDLNAEQLKAVTHGEGPLLIVAGAGTGKTTVITKRLAWLIESGKAKPDNILALTFTDKAAGEMEERLDKILPYGFVDLWVSTFHSFAERLLTSHALDIGVPYNFKLLSETEQWLLIRKHLNRFNLNYYRPLGNPTKFIHALVRHFSRAKDEAIYPEDYLKYAESLRLDEDRAILGKAKRQKKLAREDSDKNNINEAARIEEVANAYHTYQEIMLEESALDFGDLINYTVKLFRDRPDILERYQEQFKYILIDEFQDTNWVQYEMVKLLAAPANNLTVVGDDDQSIYRFRGASMSNILQFKKDYPDAASVVLTQNYRSSQNILDLAYQFIQHNNPNRLEVALAAIQPKETALTKKLQANTKDAAFIEHLSGASSDDEIALIVEKILSLKTKDKELSWSDFAVLARSNDQANAIDVALNSANIPHQSVSSKGLYTKPEIVDVLSYLRLLDNYHESPSLWRVLNMLFWNLSLRDLIEISHTANKKSWSLFEALEKLSLITNISADSRAKINKILGLIAKHSALARDRRPTEILVSAVNDIGYTAWLEQLGEEKARLSFSYLNQFYDRLKRWEATQYDPRLKEFIEAINYEVESGEEGALAIDIESGPEAVNVMTVHAAKGLEFKYVFVVNLVDRRFPTTERAEPIELPAPLVKEILPVGDHHIEEERRLFYVAMTRAKRGLFLTSAEDYGGVRKKKVSVFLNELNISLQNPLHSKTDNQWGSVASADTGETVIKSYIPDTFSFTSLKAYETCPFQYRYAHVLRVPVWGKGKFSFGKTMHKTLERFFTLLLERRQNKNQVSLFGDNAPVATAETPTLNELLKIYEESWIEEWYDSKTEEKEYYERGKNILKDFFSLHDGHWPNTKAIEQGFRLKFGDSDYALKGQIDRVDQRDGEIEIIDYKTGEKIPEKLSADQKEQLLIYELAAALLWPDQKATLTYYYLNQNKPISFRGSDEELGALKKKIAKIIEEIRQVKFKADPSSQKCKHCDFKNICPFSEA